MTHNLPDPIANNHHNVDPQYFKQVPDRYKEKLTKIEKDLLYENKEYWT
jgi:hypothetical protein